MRSLPDTVVFHACSSTSTSNDSRNCAGVALTEERNTPSCSEHTCFMSSISLCVPWNSISSPGLPSSVRCSSLLSIHSSSAIAARVGSSRPERSSSRLQTTPFTDGVFLGLVVFWPVLPEVLSTPNVGGFLVLRVASSLCKFRSRLLTPPGIQRPERSPPVLNSSCRLSPRRPAIFLVGRRLHCRRSGKPPSPTSRCCCSEISSLTASRPSRA